MDLFEKIIYINLEHRTDRKESIIKQLTENPISKEFIHPDNIYRLNAVYNKENGAAGCAKSHYLAVKMALDNGWNRVAIFEDDFGWRDSEYVIDALIKFCRSGIEWDVLLLSSNRLVIKLVSEIDADCVCRVQNVQTTGGYIINGQKYMQKMLECFKESYEKLEAGESLKTHSVDIYWKQLQPDGRWYAFRPQNLGVQLPSYSDVTNRRVNYLGYT